MATFFGVSAVPVDGAAAVNATTTITITPPASMLAGDLVVVYTQQRGAVAWTNSTAGGQSWNNVGNSTVTANISMNTFWARFNGTWAANPVFTNTGGTCTSAVMLVFRPNLNTNDWFTEQIATTAAAAAATITVTGVTPANGNNVTIASWMTADDNTWGTLTGANWVNTSLSAQYRNTSGTDQSMTFAYQLQTTAAPTNNVSQTQLTLGNDATTWRRITFYEAEPILGGFDPMGTMGFFGM